MEVSNKERPLLGLVMGDAAGIGAEITAKAVSDPKTSELARIVIIGDKRQFERGMSIARVKCAYHVLQSTEEIGRYEGLCVLDTGSLDAYKVHIGEMSVECAIDTGQNMQLAADLCVAGKLDTFCFGPNHKAAMKAANYKIHGMVDLLAQCFHYQGERGEINVVDEVFNLRVTGHIPVSEISSALTHEKILKTIQLAHDSLHHFGLDKPRIAVAALNPHGGENGTCGTEEITTIMPAIKAAQAYGISCVGPLPADTLFTQLFNRKYDAAVTMYHDQGQIAFKLKDFDNGVTLYGGIPFPVTTCAHGTAFDIAGKGVAKPNALIAALRLAAKLAYNKKIKHIEER